MATQVSIVIPTYNRADVLPRALNSVLAQTYQDFEVIVVDDCSKDNTDEIMKNFGDPRIRFIKHGTNKGGNATRNTGIQEATGEFIAFLDSDDEWLPEKLMKQMAIFSKADHTLGLVYGGQKCFNENTGRVFDFTGDKRGHVFRDMLVRNYIGTLSVVVVRAKYLFMVGGMDAQLKSCQDWDIYIRLSQVCQFDYVDDLLINYYIGKKDPNRISNNRLSILNGHEAVQRKYERYISKLPVVFRLRHAEYMRNIYVVTGELWKVLNISIFGAMALRNPRLFFSMPRSLGACIKHNILKDYGY